MKKKININHHLYISNFNTKPIRNIKKFSNFNQSNLHQKLNMKITYYHSILSRIDVVFKINI